MKVLLGIFVFLAIAVLTLVIILEGVVIREMSDKHLDARFTIKQIGSFFVDPCSPEKAFESFIEYDNLMAACGVLEQYYKACDDPDMDYLAETIDKLITLAESKHNLKLDHPEEINQEYFEYMLDELDEVSGMYPSRNLNRDN